MIHFIHGTLASLTAEHAVIDCGGVGFKLGISIATSSKLSMKNGKDVLLYTYMAVSEDNISLYGFSDEDELALFTRLISVSGIGPKAAISILGTLSPDDLRSAIANNDAKTIAQAQGVGLKTAQKLIIELKDKISLDDISAPAASSGRSSIPLPSTAFNAERLSRCSKSSIRAFLSRSLYRKRSVFSERRYNPECL